jgi:predicted transcriptional regulator YdeE
VEVNTHSIPKKGIPFCFVGAETTLLNAYLPPLVTQTIPAGTYTKFHHKGTLNTLPPSLEYFYHTWLAKSGTVLAHPIEIIDFGKEVPNPKNPISGLDIYFPIELTPIAVNHQHK